MNEKRHSKYTKIKKNEILELSDKDFKAAIINMFWQVIMSYLGTNENKKITKETEIVKKNQMETTKRKSVRTKIKACWLGSVVGWSWQRTEAMSLRTD